MMIGRIKLSKWLMVIPIAIMIASINVFIAMSTAGLVMVQLLAAGVNKNLSLGLALLLAIGIHAYIVFNHKIRDYIQKQGNAQ